MVKLIIGVIAVLLGVAVATAQTPPPPVMAGHWVISFKVTKGNDKDRARIAQGMAIDCVQNTTIVICQPDYPGSQPFKGTANGLEVTFDVETFSVPSPTGYITTCWWYGCVSGQPTSRDRMVAHWIGSFINPTLIEGQWTGILYVGLGKYPVEGTWTGIKVQ